MSTDSKAVFLSYASQDAEAARRICESLRSAGVEVWFDADGGLEHGDEWDAKIRRQIKECVLFIPLISANTQARHEGYFRIEWELAAQRALGIASGVAFILPVVIDDTREPEALVPERFRVVQWTRLRGGDLAPDVLARFLKLWSHRTGALRHEAAPTAASFGAAAARNTWWKSAGIAAAIVLLAGGAWYWKSRSFSSSLPTPISGSARPLSEGARLTAQAAAIYTKPSYTREELKLADDFARGATEASPGSADAWAARAAIQATYIQRNWDRNPKRVQDAQAFANRALALKTDHPEALLALARVLLRQGARDQAEEILRRALTVEPGNNRIRRALGTTVSTRDFEEGRAILEEAGRRDPSDPLVHYDLAQLFSGGGHAADPEFLQLALGHLDAGLALKPTVAGLLLLKAAYLARWRGDLKGMRAALDQFDTFPLSDRSDDRAVAVAMWAGLLERNPGRVRSAASLTATDYFEDDNALRHAKDWSLALANRLAGQESRARLSWQRAEALLRERLKENPRDQILLFELAVTLAWLDRGDEAAKTIEPIEKAWLEAPAAGQRSRLAHYYAAVGNAPRAVEYIRAVLDKSNDVTTKTLPLDPWWDKLRGQPEFDAFVAETQAAERRVEARGQPPESRSSAAAQLTPAAAPLSDVKRLVRQAQDLLLTTELGSSELARASALCDQALALDKSDAEVLATASQVDTAWWQYGGDVSAARTESARSRAAQALALDPKSFEARRAQAYFLVFQGGRAAAGEAEPILRRLHEERPRDAWTLLVLATLLSRQPVQLEEALKYFDEMAALPGRTATALNEKAWQLYRQNRLLEADAAVDRSIASQAFTGNVMLKMYLATRWRGDGDLALAALNKLPASTLLDDRGLAIAVWVYRWRREPNQLLSLLTKAPRDWIAWSIHGPKAALLGDAYALLNRPTAAANSWREGLALIEQKLSQTPNDRALLRWKAYLLDALGDSAGSGIVMNLVRELPVDRSTSSVIAYDLDTRLVPIEEALSDLENLASNSGPIFTANYLRLNPAFDRLREQPRFRAVLARLEAEGRVAPKPAP